MQLGIGPHLDDTDLEQYSMGVLPVDRLAPFEEHFLACVSCQDRLLEMEDFVSAMRSASAKLREARWSRWRQWFHWPRPLWVAGVPAGALVLAMGVWMLAPGKPVEIAAVVLQSSRGIDGLSLANAPAGKPLSLKIDTTELPASRSYRIEIVNALGTPVVWQTAATPQNGVITQALSNGLSAGQYYVRLYGPSGELLREFGLRSR